MSTVQVAVDNATFHFDKLYTYRLPPQLEGQVFEGSMVLVPFGRGNRPRMAVVLAVGEEPAAEKPARLKELFAAAPEQARLTPDLLKLVHFLKERTFCTYYEAVRAIIPYGAQYRPELVDGKPTLRRQLLRQEVRYHRTARPVQASGRITDKQRTALNLLAAGGPQTAAQLEAQGVTRAVLEALLKKGLAEKQREDQDARPMTTAETAAPEPPPALTEEQQRAYDQLAPNLEDHAPHAALLYGVTGSGKTLVFLQLIRRTLELGRQALILVPEISLTPQMIRRLKDTFGARVAVQHSALSNTERLVQWQMIQQGGADIVVGTQMIAKGHDFQRVSVVGVLNADAQLVSPDLRAEERLFATLMQVAGRAGRGETTGEVAVQTRFPDHPIYDALKHQDYEVFAERLLNDRRDLNAPPFVFQALLKAQANTLERALGFLTRAAAAASVVNEDGAVFVYDPVPMSLFRLMDVERGQLLVESASRSALHRFLKRWTVQMASETGVSWRIEVDPQEV